MILCVRCSHFFFTFLSIFMFVILPLSSFLSFFPNFSQWFLLFFFLIPFRILSLFHFISCDRLSWYMGKTLMQTHIITLIVNCLNKIQLKQQQKHSSTFWKSLRGVVKDHQRFFSCCSLQRSKMFYFYSVCLFFCRSQ